MRIQLDASLKEFRFTSNGREVCFRPVLWVSGNEVLSVGQPPPGLSEDAGIRIFASPHPDAMEFLECLLRYGVRQFRTSWISRRLELASLHIRIGRDVHERLSGFAKDIFAMAAKRSGAMLVKCDLAE